MSPSTVPDAKAVWTSCVTAAMSGDIAAQTDHYHDDAVLEFPFLLADDVPHRFEGRAAIGEFFATMHAAVAANDTEIDREAATVSLLETSDPEVLVAEITLPVRHGAGREPGVNRYVQVVRVRDGRIAEMRDYFAGPVTEVVTAALRG